MLQCIGAARFTRYCCDATDSHFISLAAVKTRR
jgi:hypothetical protein